jgi:hypothetical protein
MAKFKQKTFVSKFADTKSSPNAPVVNPLTGTTKTILELAPITDQELSDMNLLWIVGDEVSALLHKPTIQQMKNVVFPPLIEQITTDQDIYNACQAATYTAGQANITPANGKVFYKGQFAKIATTSYLYFAIADNIAVRITLG